MTKYGKEKQMNKIKNVLTFLATLLLAALACFAVWGAFSGPFRTKFIANSMAFAFFWIIFVVIIFISLFFLGSPFRRPGLFLINAGVICIIIGALASSTDANNLMKKYLKIDKVHKGIMQLYKGQIQNVVLLDNFDIEKAPQSGRRPAFLFQLSLRTFASNSMSRGFFMLKRRKSNFGI